MIRFQLFINLFKFMHLELEVIREEEEVKLNSFHLSKLKSSQLTNIKRQSREKVLRRISFTLLPRCPLLPFS